MGNCRYSILAALRMAIALCAVLVPVGAGAQTCTPEQIFAVIDETGARLRQINDDAKPALVAKLKAIGGKRGWADTDLESNGRQLLDDAEIRKLDRQAGVLLDRLSRLGDDEQSKGPTCDRLSEAKTTASQLIEVTNARAAHVSAKLDLASNGKPAATTSATAPAAAKPDSTKSAQAKPGQAKPAPQVALRTPAPAAPPARAPTTKPPAAKPPNAASWGAGTTVREITPAPEVLATLPRPLEPGELSFTPQDIQAAGRGFFGSISTGLASVINYAFTTYGQPTGYILGSEGGGAFLAGLRYGDGRLVTKLGGEQKVYWQGPSVGYDIGLAGSRVMFLVYNMKDHQQIFTRFVGVDGSAYLVGGVGITFLKRGPLVLAPIRTGLGLRIGANVGYLKFTPAPSLNPF